ncbi:MAG: hypothetical protein JST01_05055 [Cyanobacteria bacterium SZAS TMP-1]|nr:hypothetical protein [Cyanobacteria bacterium SZAS TMP-1]
MLERLFKVIEMVAKNLAGELEDPAIMLEQTYQDLQERAIYLKGVAAQVIAAEERLKQAISTSKGRELVDLEAQLREHQDAMGKFALELTQVKNELSKVEQKRQLLIARDRSARATMKANEILSNSPLLDTVEDIERALMGLPRIEKVVDPAVGPKRKDWTGLAIYCGFALVLLILSTTFLVYVFLALPQSPTKLVLIPATFVFMTWIGWRESKWFLRNAGILWREMSKDVRDLISRRKD